MDENDELFINIFAITTFYFMGPILIFFISMIVEMCYFSKIFKNENLKIYKLMKKING